MAAEKGDKRMKKLVIALTAVILLVTTCPSISFADDKFIDNVHWIETDGATINQKYQKNEDFIIMFFRTTCFNSGLRKVMLDRWMNEYGIDIYGVDVDKYGIPSWVGMGSVTLPVICIVENGKADAYDANTSMKVIQKRVNEYAGIYDDADGDFSGVVMKNISSYNTNEDMARTRYLKPASTIDQRIVEEAEKITAGCSSDMDKLKKIYDWVTENIFYNFGIIDGTVTGRNMSAIETYIYKDSVCSGYANLTLALCHAVGIPCRVVTGFATGIGSDGSIDEVWEIYSKYMDSDDLAGMAKEMNRYTNHAWNEAYADGRWVILDTTWGSNNDYYPDARGKIYGTPSEKYFDISAQDLASTHLFWSAYSAGLTGSKSSSGSLTVTGHIESTDLTRFSTGFVAAYDKDGRFLGSTSASISNNTFTVTISGCASADTVEVFLLDSNNCPYTTPYYGDVT